MNGEVNDSEWRRAEKARLMDVRGALKRFPLVGVLGTVRVSSDDDGGAFAGVGGIILMKSGG